MRRMHLGIIVAGVLVGITSAVVVSRLKSADPGPPQTTFVSADGTGVIELPSDPIPLPLEPDPASVSRSQDTSSSPVAQSPAVLLQPEPVPGVEVTVGHRSPPEGAFTPDVDAPAQTTAPFTPLPEQAPMPAAVVVHPETAVVEDVVAVPEQLPMPALVEATPEAAPSATPAPPEDIGMPPTADEPVAQSPYDRTEVPADSVPPPPAAPPACVAAPLPAPPSAPLAQCRPLPLPLPQLVLAVAHKRGLARGEYLPVSGTFDCTLEDQTELTLSPVARDQLDKPHVLFVALAPDKKCLWFYTAAGVERLADRLDRAAGGEELARCTRRMCFSRLHRVHATPDGTFTLPVDLVEVACLKGNVLLIGVRDHFELWDARQWQQYIGQEEPAEHNEITPEHGSIRWQRTPESNGNSAPPQMVIDRVHGGITLGQGTLVPGQ